ncbi:MAG: sigma-70 family RNA polymerase sigma factor [Ruminococcaceae bacterium]|nr:sigma-70 family RNA polymerase sigma factor [Oscillospiraceae bacterium]
MDIFTLFGNLLVFILHVTNAESFPPPLSKKEEAETIEKMLQGDEAAKEKLIKHNLRLVAHIIKKYYSTYSDQDDLISIGTIGLIKGINSFKPEKGTKLATYVSRCIENEILMYFRNIKKTSQEISFSEPIDVDNEGNPLTLMDIISIDDTIIEDIDYKEKLKKTIEIIDNIKNKREKQIIIMRYGLDGNPPQTQKEVAKALKISRSYVSRIEKRIIEAIRDEFK